MRFFRTATAAAFLAFAGVAHGADLIVDEPVVESSSIDWSGFYAGINGGYGSSDATSVVGPINPAGPIAGVQAGYNQTVGKFVVGVEGDLQWSGVKGSHVGPTITSSASLDYFGTLRLRGGLPVDRFLPYITAGVSAGQVSGTSTFGGGFTTTRPGLGLTAGVGAEYAVTDNLSLKAEYLYVDYGDITFFPGTAIEEKIRSRMGAIRVGLNYRF
jgi:outer membrane immunogenic protein